MKLYEYLNICNNYDTLINFLIEQKVIHGVMFCTKCNSKEPMKFNSKDLMFHCYASYFLKNRNKKRVKIYCKSKISALHDTWFNNIHNSVQNICRFVGYHLMLKPPRQEFLQNELEISSATAVDWASFCRELCTLWSEKHSVAIGGENEIVEVDEAKIGKRKFNKGRLVTGQWIFGGIERSTKRIFIIPVPNRTSATLLTVIQNWIKPGTTIISDCWKAYDCLNKEGFKHLRVNHKMNFVDPETNAHTQNIERVWRETRANIPRYGTREVHYVGYLAEFLFRRQYDFNDRIINFFKIMAEMFPTSDNINKDH